VAFDPLTLVMLAVLVILILFTVRNGRKRQRDIAAMHDRTQVGADVMTNFGVFGTIVGIDDEENKILLETSPGTILTVHRQTIAKIVTADDAVSDDDIELMEDGDVETATELDANDPRFRTDSGSSAADPYAPKKSDD